MILSPNRAALGWVFVKPMMAGGANRFGAWRGVMIRCRLLTAWTALALLAGVTAWKGTFPSTYHQHQYQHQQHYSSKLVMSSSSDPRATGDTSKYTRGDVLRTMGLGLLGGVLGGGGMATSALATAERSPQERQFELFRRGLALTQQFQFSEAEKVYTEIIGLFGEPSSLSDRDKTIMARALSNRGNCRSAMDQIEQALVDYSKALELSPDIDEFWLNRGYAYESLGDRLLYSAESNAKQFYEAAVSDYNHASVLAPSDHKIYITIGDVQMHLGKFDDALESYRMGVALSPSSPATRGKVALSEVQVGNMEKGELIVQSILKRNPDYAEMQLASAAIDWTSGRFMEGLDMFADAIMKDPRLYDMRYLHMNLHWPPAMLAMVGALRTAGTTPGFKAKAVSWFESGQPI